MSCKDKCGNIVFDIVCVFSVTDVEVSPSLEYVKFWVINTCNFLKVKKCLCVCTITLYVEDVFFEDVVVNVN